MPTEHVLTMLRATPPRRAVTTLLSMPKDRVVRLLAAMDGRLLARLLLAADPDRRAGLLRHLDDGRLGAELALLPMIEAAAVLAALPAERARQQLGRISPEYLGVLLDILPAAQRRRLVAVLDPGRAADLRRVCFERAVIESLGRTAAALRWLPDDPGCNLLAAVFQRLFGVALCYVDEGPLGCGPVVRARQVFADQRVDGVLIVTNAAPDGSVADLVGCAPQDDLKALVATWESGDNGGVLGRALVRLAG
ncbi:magnesium transporter MgtE N-terminal domain-containing protein [Actinoplanes sp. NPDC049599]|uniref:magnesium transporter MgtE N-terminal domain-containing protein n=1 Tax=Actinoplanes sp. NPDC049599 TaxID=3363903 RepID=UPI0037A764D6